MERSGFVLLNGPSQYSTASFDDASPSTLDSSINALAELARESDVDEEFNLKLQLYETKDAFFGQEIDIENTDEEIEVLKDQVKKGQKMLKAEILKYSSLKDELEQANNLSETFHSQVIQLKRTLMCMEEINIQHDDYVKDLTNMQNSVDELDSKVTVYLNNLTTDAKKDYDVSFKKLIHLKDVYQVCRNSDVSYVCPVCIQNPVEAFMVPCGHTYCKECISKGNNIRRICHMCRNPYTRICNLYYG